MTKEELDKEFADFPQYYVSTERNIRVHIQELEDKLELCRQHLYNPFEPDNQSNFYYKLFGKKEL